MTACTWLCLNRKAKAPRKHQECVWAVQFVQAETTGVKVVDVYKLIEAKNRKYQDELVENARRGYA